ncbi:MAG: esterase family protein [Fibrobacteres bacterium]|nr:esterase family protein [Fibrobacterota bacterium]
MMNKARLSLTVLLLGFAAVFADQSQPWNNPSGGSLPTGCQHLTYYSPANKTTIGYVIYLPPDYNSNATARYPVVYSLHGMGGNEWGNVPYAPVLQSKILSKEINPMIMVFVSGRGNTFYADSKDGAVKCETSIVNELIPHIDSLFRTLPDRGHRAVNGISMGGFGALMLAMKHFELFGHVCSDIAALVNWDTLSAQQFDQSIPKGIFGSDSNYFNSNYYPPTFVKKNADTLKALGMTVHMADNPQDTPMGPLYSYNLSMRNLLKSKGIPVEFDSAAGVGHSADFSGASGIAILKFHSAAFAAAPVTSVFANPSLRFGSAPAFGRMNGIRTLAIPAQWHGASEEVVVYSLYGRDLGRQNIQGADALDGAELGKRFGSNVLIIKPVGKSE